MNSNLHFLFANNLFVNVISDNSSDYPDYYLSLNIKHRQVNVSIKSDFQEENQNSKR